MKSERAIINRLSAVGVLGNILLSVFKFIAGILGNSGAMISDAVHSLSDVGATAIAYIGATMALKQEDHNHPYGHERFECIATAVLGSILLITGFFIGYEAVVKIVNGNYGGEPEMIALIAAVVSIVTKELMYHYTMHYAKILNSDCFKADAWHHRSDAISSLAALIGIGLAMSGFPIMDPIASIVISLFILKLSIGIVKDGIEKIVDTACDDATLEEMKKTVYEVEGVDSIDVLNTRKFGNKILVDIEISVDGNLSVEEGHAIAETVNSKLMKEFCSIKHVMVHVNPSEPPDE